VARAVRQEQEEVLVAPLESAEENVAARLALDVVLAVQLNQAEVPDDRPDLAKDLVVLKILTAEKEDPVVRPEVKTNLN
jgi:hypothetical protein